MLSDWFYRMTYNEGTNQVCSQETIQSAPEEDNMIHHQQLVNDSTGDL
jgi:hypothetical protein